MQRMHTRSRIGIRIATGMGVAFLAASALAGAAVLGPAYDVSWYSVDGGGGTSAGGGFTLAGAIGQPDAGTASGGDFVLVGGFFAGGGGETAPPCPGDIDGGGAVDFGDLLSVLAAFGSCSEPCPEDLDGNGAVDFSDLLTVLAAFGPCPS
jgi:hypothetical protein